MILKQNLFTITDKEIEAVENGTYIHRQKYFCQSVMVPNEWGAPIHMILTKHKDVEIDVPTSYTGSSLQRQRVFREMSKQEYLHNAKMNMAKRVIKKCREDARKLQKLPSTKDIEHRFSNRSKIKLANKITAWTRANRAVKNKVLYNFITLTLTSKQKGTDKDFTKMLNVFFTYLRKYYNLKNYLYVLERQTNKTQNIHAHILVDQYVPYQGLNRIWCKILSDNGYTFPSLNYDTGLTETVSVTEALKRYYDAPQYNGSFRYVNPRTGKNVKPTRSVNMPNPCDVETIYNLKAVSVYITKYITKNDSTINTTLWNCSNTISRLWTGAIINPQLYYYNLRSHVVSVVHKVLDNGLVLNVCLLKFYTKIQEKIFSINHKIICT